MSSHNRPTLEQMKRDADYLKKLRGYCSKAVKTLEDLPYNHAYSALSSQLYPVTREDVGKIPSPEDCKYSLHRIWGISYSIEGYIQQLGGPRRVPYKSKLSDEEIAKRMRGEYSHTSIPQPDSFHFSEKEKQQLRQCIPKIEQKEFVFFVELTEETISGYLYNNWAGKPNREDDLDRLSTLYTQVERVLENISVWFEMTEERYKYSDGCFPGHARGCVDNVRKLLDATEDATKKIKQYPRRSKPLEYEMVDEIAYSFWKSTGKKPSAHNKFMDVVSVIKAAIGSNAEPSIMGERLIESVIKELPTPHQK